MVSKDKKAHRLQIDGKPVSGVTMAVIHTAIVCLEDQINAQMRYATEADARSLRLVFADLVECCQELGIAK